MKSHRLTMNEMNKEIATMKRSLILTLLMSSALTANAAYRDVVVADQPVGYWRLGEAAGSTVITNAGSLGAAGDGTIFRNVTMGQPGALKGDANTAANLDGAQAKIDVPFAAALNTPVFTMEAWAKVTSGSSGYRSPLASRDDSPQRGFIFYANPSDQWQFWTGTGVQVGWNTVGGAAVELDAWAHLVGSYDGTNKVFYVNGVLVGANQSAFTPNGARGLRIGGSATESALGDFFFNGDLDEVAVYNKVLSPDRVVAHFTAGAGAAPDASVAPAIVVQPAPLNRFQGESAAFTALVTGSLPLRYQWQKNGANIAGATNAVLLLARLQPSDGADYAVTVSNGAGSLPSNPATLTVADVSKPVITQQPRSRTVLPGSAATLSVTATGSTVFDYQWQLNGQNIVGATNGTLTIASVQTANLGAYKVVVKNSGGSTDSAAATLQFPPPATRSYVDTVKQDSPVAYWRLGETTGDIAKDLIGANDGSYLNGVTLGRPSALVGDTNSAAGFARANRTKIDVPWSAALNTPVFTFECWAKVTGGSGNYRSPVTSRADGPQRGYIFYAEPNNTWQFWTGTGASTGWTTLQGPAVQVNAYAHLVGIYDGTNLLFYVNGALAAQRAAVFGQNDASPLRIGGGATEGDGDFFFEGDVDEVAVFNTALSEDRILAHYVAGFPLTTPPSISSQPKALAALAGGNVSFAVGASGGQPLSYQWRFNGQNLTNATRSTLALTNVSAANVGTYAVVVSNAGGSITSSNVTLTIPTAPTKAYVDLIKGDGPVGYWRLDESTGDTAKDVVGTDDGIYLNAVTLGASGAIVTDSNKAANFVAASSQKIDVPWSDKLNPPIFSVEVWARVTGGAGAYRSPLTSRADGPQRGFIFYAEPGNTWQFWTGKGDTSGWDNIPGPAVQINRWAHLVATYDGTTKRFYVNGVEVGTSTAAFAVNDQSVLRFGGGATEGNGNYFFEGDVDEPAIYNKVLTPEQIILHYLGGITAAKAPSITLARQGANLTLTWGTGSLESAGSVLGPWTAVANASSPYSVTPNQSARFYRLRQ
jgi:hypothetical protein